MNRLTLIRTLKILRRRRHSRPHCLATRVAIDRTRLRLKLLREVTETAGDTPPPGRGMLDSAPTA